MEQKKLIKGYYDTAERVSGYILNWEKTRGKIHDKALKNLESKGTTKFTRKQKIAISEWASEFGQQAPKVSICLWSIEMLLGKIPIDKNKYPNIVEFIETHTINPPINIKYVRK